MRVLIPRGGAWGADAAQDLREVGHEGLVLPLIQLAPAEDQDALQTVLTDLAAGRFDWLVVTSANVVRLLPRIPAATNIAAVGNVAAAALRERGMPVAFIPRRQSNEGLVDEWPLRSGTVAWLHSADASSALRDGLHDRGMTVTTAIAYRTLPLVERAEDLSDDATLQRTAPELQAAGHDHPVRDESSDDEPVDQALTALEPAESPVDAVLLTSPSVAKLVQQLRLPDDTIYIAADPQTERSATRRGLRVAATAKDGAPAAFVAALDALAAS